MFRLLVTHNHEEQVFCVPEGEARIGSSSDNDLVLRLPGVSRRHALLRRCPGGVELKDLDSKNGLLVAGWRVARAILTPGLQLQIGAAWIELEEISASEAAFAHSLAERLEQDATASAPTAALQIPQSDDPEASSPEAALRLAYHLDLMEASAPEERRGTLARIRTALGAELLASGTRLRHRPVELLETTGSEVSPQEQDLLSSLAGTPAASSRSEIRLKRSGAFLLAQRGRYFLAARFVDEAVARESWRRDFFRFAAAHWLAAVPPRREAIEGQIRRVLAATGGNKSETARILGITRQTIYAMLKRAKPPKES